MTTPYEPPDAVLERLRDIAEVTTSHILEYLAHQYEWNLRNLDMMMAVQVNPFSFFAGERDLAEYRAAIVWWPKHEFVPLAPTLIELCFNFNGGGTFLERLNKRAEAAVAACKEHKVPLPNAEPTEERKARLNRGRVKRSREASTERKQNPATAEAYATYMRVCAERRASQLEWDAKVAEAYRAFMVLKQAS